MAAALGPLAHPSHSVFKIVNTVFEKWINFSYFRAMSDSEIDVEVEYESVPFDIKERIP